mmetsp:Transcript_19858/g.35952  ORF Transcript_19858/g.35952 Transcript_19858/m.35952 type:complete len:105 (-) Transcript_19858:866-1180(-)
MRCSGSGLHSAAGTADEAARFGSPSLTLGVVAPVDAPAEAVADAPEIHAAKDTFSAPACGFVLRGAIGFRPSGANGWQEDRAGSTRLVLQDDVESCPSTVRTCT